MKKARTLTRAGIAGLLAVALAAVPARGDELAPRNQALLLLRVLAYDRNLARRAGPRATVLVLYRPGDLGSESRRSSLRTAFEEVAREVVVSGLAVEVEEVAFRSAADLDAKVAASSAALVYVDRALAPELAEITRATRVRSALTAAGARELLPQGVAVAVVASGTRAAILVNLAAARREGADLDSALLGIAEVLRDEAERPDGAPRAEPGEP